MTPITPALRRAAALGLALTLAGAATAAAKPHDPEPRGSERLVVRGESTILDMPCGPGGCPVTMRGGTFRGTPVGTGAYAGDLVLDVARSFDNGEGGVCAPIGGSIVLGAGSPDRLRLRVTGDSCQDGDGPPPSASFTTVVRFRVTHGTGAYAGAHGRGIGVFAEDAADHDRMTLIGRIARPGRG